MEEPTSLFTVSETNVLARTTTMPARSSTILGKRDSDQITQTDNDEEDHVPIPTGSEQISQTGNEGNDEEDHELRPVSGPIEVCIDRYLKKVSDGIAKRELDTNPPPPITTQVVPRPTLVCT